MVVDRLERLGLYASLGEGFAKAAQFLAGKDAATFALGDVEIDGREVYAFVKQTELTKENTAWEAHERYADIQIILDGAERMGYLPFLQQEVVTPYNPEKDCGFYQGDAGTELTLAAGDFVIFLPGELHRPDCPVGAQSVSKKMVVKVRIH